MWWQKAFISVASSTMAAALMGLLLGIVGANVRDSVRTSTLLVLAWFSIVFVAVELLSGRRLLPQRDRETPQRLLHYGPILWAVYNGALLGVGFASRLGTWLWFTVPVFSFASGSPYAGAAIFGLYGFVRLSILAILSWVAIRRPSVDVAALALSQRMRALRTCNIIFIVVCAVGLVSFSA